MTPTSGPPLDFLHQPKSGERMGWRATVVAALSAGRSCRDGPRDNAYLTEVGTRFVQKSSYAERVRMNGESNAAMSAILPEAVLVST